MSYCTDSQECYLQAVELQDNLTLPGYSPWVFPLIGLQQNLSITGQVFIYKLLQLTNEKVLAAAIEVDLWWIDPNINWPTNDNITALVTPSSRVWTMNLFLFNAATPSMYFQPFSNTFLYWSSSGTSVTVFFIYNMYAVCEAMRLRNFPFDRQTCYVHLLYRGDNYESVVFQQSVLTLSDSVASSAEWHIDNVSTVASLLNSSVSPYPGMSIVFELTRQSLYFVLNLIVPTVILNAVTAISFCIPFESNQRITVITALVLGAFLLHTTVSNMLPHFQPDDVPKIVISIQVCFVLAAVSLAESVVLVAIRIAFPTLPLLGLRAFHKVGVTFGFVDQSLKSACVALYNVTLFTVSETAQSLVENACSTLHKDGKLSQVGDLHQAFEVAKKRLALHKSKHKERRNVKEEAELLERSWLHIELFFSILSLLIYITCIVYFFGFYSFLI